MSASSERAELDAVLQAVPVGITVFEAVRDAAGALIDLRLTRRNELALSLSRIPAEKYKPGALLSELMPKELYENFERMLDVVRTGEQMEHELYQPHLDKWILSLVKPHADGILSTIQDITHIKRYGQEKSRQARMLSGVLEATPNGITVFEAIRNSSGEIVDFTVIQANERVIQLSGCSIEEYLGKTLLERLPDQAKEIPRLAALIEAGRIEESEFFSPENQRWIHITISPLGDGFVSSIQDITAQKQQQELVLKAAQTLEGVLQASPHAILVFESVRDHDGVIRDFRILRFNYRAIAATGLGAEQLQSATLFECLPSWNSRLDQFVTVVNNGTADAYDYYDAPSRRWKRVTNTPLGDGFVMTMEDITEHKAQSEKIEEQAQLFNGVLSSLQNGLSILRVIRNEDGSLNDIRYLAVADSVLNNTGRTREQTIGQSMRELFPGIEQTEYWRAYAQAAATGEPVQFESHFTLQGYDNYLVNWVTSIGSDTLVSVYYIVNDLKRIQRELEHKVQELRRSNDDLEQFASIASHDLQEPLRKVQSFGAMLESRYGEILGDSGRDLLSRMTGAATRMRNLVTGLLSFARLSGEEHVPFEPVDLNMVVTEVMQDIDQSEQAPGGTVNIVSRLPFVLGIESQLRQLFHNLLVNAFKFHQPGRSTQVSISAYALGKEEMERLPAIANPGDYLCIEVADDGIGFEPEFAERIFGLFERLHGVSKYQGTGLGLSICRRVAARHGGTIWAEGAIGKGATFKILLQKAPKTT